MIDLSLYESKQDFPYNIFIYDVFDKSYILHKEERYGAPVSVGDIIVTNGKQYMAVRIGHADGDISSIHLQLLEKPNAKTVKKRTPTI